MFHGTKVLGTFAPEERKFHGSESSLYGLFAPGNESAEERKGLESCPVMPMKSSDRGRNVIMFWLCFANLNFYLLVRPGEFIQCLILRLKTMTLNKQRHLQMTLPASNNLVSAFTNNLWIYEYVFYNSIVGILFRRSYRMTSE